MSEVTYQLLDDKYGDVTADKLASMSKSERQEYYGALYQYVGYIIGILHIIDPTDGDDDKYPTISVAEYFVLSAAGNAHTALLDALAGLAELTEESAA